MNESEYQKIDAVVPGVSDAYASLKSQHYRGIHTSMGRFYNHTVFGRDSSMVAKFAVDFDHRLALEVILTLARLQGVQNDPTTQEEPGRIHHEWRDYRLWQAKPFDRLLLYMLKRLWGGSRHILLTYFSADTTAGYIRLVHRYAMHIDRSVLERTIVTRSQDTITIGESVARAAAWLSEHVDDDGVVRTRRTNWFALPYQTFQDSVTAYTRLDGSLANYKQPIGYVEVQAFATEAFYDACELLPDHSSVHEWRHGYEQTSQALIRSYWQQDEQFMTSALASDGKMDLHNISAAWTLNVSMWENMDEDERVQKISALVRRTFSNDFLTTVGVRSRALNQPATLPDVVEYHGRLTVWPMFTFMVIEGLYRHRLYTLAAELEKRLLNGVNLTSHFDEFFIVRADGSVVVQDNKRARSSLAIQMIPERNIAFTIVPALVSARRAIWPDLRLPQDAWQKALEAEVMSSIESIALLSPENAVKQTQVEYMKLRRLSGTLKSARYFMRKSRGMK
jgi:hypothetical protein